MVSIGIRLTPDQVARVERVEQEIAADDHLVSQVDRQSFPAAERIAMALERIADALETRNAIDGQMAEFAELLSKSGERAPTDERADLAPDGLPWGAR